MKTAEINGLVAMGVSTAIAVTVWWNVGLILGGWGELALWLFTVGVLSTMLNAGSALSNSANRK